MMSIVIVSSLFSFIAGSRLKSVRMAELKEQAVLEVGKRHGDLRQTRDELVRLVEESTEELSRSNLLLELADSERSAVQDALIRSETRNRALVNALPDLILLIDRHGIFLDCHQGKGIDLFAGSQELIGRSVVEIFPIDVATEFMRILRQVLETGHPQIFEFHLGENGKQHDYEARFVGSGENEVMTIVRDITERNRLERDILEASGREQRRIGQDLHDGLGQLLTGISFLSRGLAKKLSTKNLEEAEEIREIASLVKDAIAQTRGLAHGLVPVVVEEEGLVAALSELAVTTENLFRIPCQFDCSEPVSISDHSMAIHLYHIVQEAVNNAVKHGKPTQIRIRLDIQEDDRITLTVKDDGIGFPEEMTEFQGVGLRSMNYRAQIIGAAIYFQRDEEGWTNVICSFKQRSSS